MPTIKYQAMAGIPLIRFALDWIHPFLQYHWVDRVLGFISNRPNWDIHPLTRKRVYPTPFGSGGGGHTRLRERVGGPNSDEGTDNVVLKVYIGMYFAYCYRSGVFKILNRNKIAPV